LKKHPQLKAKKHAQGPGQSSYWHVLNGSKIVQIRL